MNQHNYEFAFIDLMISLVAIFLVIMVISLSFKAQHHAVKTVDEIINHIKQELNKQSQLNLTGVTVDRVKGEPLSLAVNVNEYSLKFGFNSYELSQTNKIFLNKIMRTIVSVLYKYKDKIEFVRFEGHTDNVGGNKGMGNIILSQNRALAVLNYSIESIFHDIQNYRLFLTQYASICGYGNLYPLKNDSISRRVVIKITVRPQELANLFAKEST